MLNMGISSSVASFRLLLAAAARAVPGTLANLHGGNVKQIYEESLQELRLMVYGSPPGTYVRTEDLLAGHKLRRAGLLSWVIYNDMPYAGYVHDGTSQMPPRPWVQNVLDRRVGESSQRVLNGVTALLQFS